MTASQIERLIKVLKANGVTRFRGEDLEIDFAAAASSSPTIELPIPKPSEPEDVITLMPMKMPSSTTEPKKNPARANAGDIPTKNIDIPHHFNQMVSVLKMSDEELVNQLFPEGKPLEPNQARN